MFGKIVDPQFLIARGFSAPRKPPCIGYGSTFTWYIYATNVYTSSHKGLAKGLCDWPGNNLLATKKSYYAFEIVRISFTDLTSGPGA